MIKIEIIQLLTKRVLPMGLAFGAGAFAFAQQKMDVSGKIVNRENSVIPYASVIFKSKANPIYSDATLTDEKGQYRLQLIPGSYEVTVEAIDFKKKTTPMVIKGGNLSPIVLEPEDVAPLTSTQSIEAVTITAASKPFKVELDKRIYDPATDVVSKGGNLQDVLNNVPSVTVDTDGSVSLRGNTNIKFLINGKPSSLLGIDDGATALQSIPADQIERIEVITNPSSKFEASGTAGILNIILKKTKKVGFNGSVIGNFGYLPRTSLNTNLNWRSGNWTWYVNGGGSYQKNETTIRNYMVRKSQASTLPPSAFPFAQTSKQDGLVTRETNNYYLTGGIVHDFSDRTSVSLSGIVRTFDSDNFAENIYSEQIFSNVRDFNLVSRNRNSEGNSKNLATQIDFTLDQKLDDKGQILFASGSYQTSRTKGINQITQNSYVDQMLQPIGNSVNHINTESYSDTFIGKIDYELPIGEVSKLEAGTRFDYNKNTYDYFVTQSNDGGATFTRYDFTSNTIYSENILGIYAQFKSRIGKKVAYQLGLRSETSKIDIDFSNYDRITGAPIQHPKVKKEYTKFFPSVFLSYDLNKNNQILLNYSRRINRPQAFNMIPFMSFDDDRNYFRGNPDLNPTYENSFELGYSVSKRKYTINPTLYYKKSEDEMYRFQFVDENNAINTIPYNIGSNTNYGLDINGTYDPFSWWKLMFSTNFYGYKNEGALALHGTFNDFSGQGFAYRMRLNSTFKPTKTLNVQIQTFYRGAEKTAMRTRKATYGIDLGASKTLWKGNGSLAFNIRDVFNTRWFRIDSDTEQFTRNMEMQFVPRQFSLSLTYRFKQGEKVEQPKRRKDINSNYDGDDSPM